MTNAGGWTDFDFNVSETAQAVFKEALTGLVGVSYSPLAVATQIVSGTNFCFLCKAQPVYPGAQGFVAQVYIYKPLQGAAHLTQIVHLRP